MTTSTVQPGLSAIFASPYTPIGHVNGHPVYAVLGGRRGGGIQVIAADDDGSSDGHLFDRDGRDDDDDDEDDEPDDDEPGEDDDPRARRRTTRNSDGDDDEDGWTPPGREEFARIEGALKRANGEAAKRRNVGKVMKRLGIEDGDLDSWLLSRGLDPDTGQPIGDAVVGDDDGGNAVDGYERETEVDEPVDEPPARKRRDDREVVRQLISAERRGEQKALNRLTPILAQQAAETALRAAGFDGDRGRLDMMLRFIDPAQVDVEVDDDGFEVLGVDEQVAELREQFPELFGRDRSARRRTAADTGAGTDRAARRRGGAREVDGGSGNGRGGNREPTTWVERAAAQMARRHG